MSNRLYNWEVELDFYPISNVTAQGKDPDRMKDLLEHKWPLFVQDPAGLTAAGTIDKNAQETDKTYLETYKLLSGKVAAAAQGPPDQSDIFTSGCQAKAAQTRMGYSSGVISMTNAPPQLANPYIPDIEDSAPDGKTALCPS
ncbi:MAG: hypothetical protein Q9216_007154, partial [Gyalolechia sp. 2 TL-2023]